MLVVLCDINKLWDEGKLNQITDHNETFETIKILLEDSEFRVFILIFPEISMEALVGMEEERQKKARKQKQSGSFFAGWASDYSVT